MSFKEIQKIKWLQRWAGAYTFISCSYWGHQYYYDLKKGLGLNFSHTLFVHREGTSAFYLAEREYKKLGQTMAARCIKDYGYAKKYCQATNDNTDILLPMMKSFSRSIPSSSEYQKFLKFYDRHISFQVFIKKTIDFFSPKDLKRFEPIFKDARIYSEPIYSESEKLYRKFAKRIARKEGYRVDYVTCLTKLEFEAYVKNRKLPPEKELAERFKASVLYFENGEEIITTGEKVRQIEKLLKNQSMRKDKKITGTPVYPGRVRGTARIVLNPHKVKVFNKGDILFTGMTRPEFIPVVRSAAAIVTDVGGVLCHAAITAREMKKPCIIGTQVATKIFKDGDLVEVDANKGIVRKIK